MSLSRAAALVLGLALLPATARAELFDCTIKDASSSQGYISPSIVILHEADSGKVRVEDAIIHSAVGDPVEAKIASETAKKLTISWIIPLKDTHGQQMKMLYRAIVTKATGAISVSATPQGYANSFRGKGQCTKK